MSHTNTNELSILKNIKSRQQCIEKFNSALLLLPEFADDYLRYKEESWDRFMQEFLSAIKQKVDLVALK